MRFDVDCLATERLRGERMRAEHADALDAIFTDPLVMATLGGYQSRPVRDGYLKRYISHWDLHGFGKWLLRDAENGDVAGYGGLHHYTLDGRDEVELGYALLPSYWGRGFASEAAREMVRVGFDVLERDSLVSFTLPTNAASRGVMERAGFRYERDFVHTEMLHVLCRLPNPRKA
jgi:RimJ/RimL family protein N-acetyltransferase